MRLTEEQVRAALERAVEAKRFTGGVSTEWMEMLSIQTDLAEDWLVLAAERDALAARAAKLEAAMQELLAELHRVTRDESPEAFFARFADRPDVAPILRAWARPWAQNDTQAETEP